ncbi:MAG: glycosyltransferase family 4 protein [Bacteroidales bacterium]|nr:glycosyltransferase family 4 protein [Bacteroidales bacterium]MCF6341736.1 glycosyltransferase family 4 protein [Bacteroidales bacterium]
MRILFVLEYYHPNIGGVETLFKKLAESLVQKGNEVEVITMRFKPVLAKTELINGVRVRRLRLTNRIFFALFSTFKVVAASRNCDLIHTTSSSSGFPAAVAGWLSNKKVVVTFHELWGKLWFQLPYMNMATKAVNYLFEQIIARLPYDKVVAVSDFTGESLLKSGMLPEKVTRIYNGLDYKNLEGYAHKPQGSFTFAFFGRPGVSKGLDILLPAAAMFFSDNPDTKLKLIIPSRPKASYRKVMSQLKKLEISGQTDVLSDLNHEELKSQLCSSHCVVIPSYSEGFSFAAAETVAMGIPVISSDKGALKETVSGKFIKMKSLTTEALCDALRQAQKKGWTISSVRRFELDTQVKSYEQLYSSMLKGRKG